MFVGYSRYKYTNAQQKIRQDNASRYVPKDDRLKTYGCHGNCFVTDTLPYTSFNDLFVLPTYHLLLHGVLRNFWDFALKASNGILSKKDRDAMSLRQPGVIGTSDFGRRYTDVVTTFGTWTMSDWLAFADVRYKFICKDIRFKA